MASQSPSSVRLRSWLHLDGCDPQKLEATSQFGADALIIDLAPILLESGGDDLSYIAQWLAQHVPTDGQSAKSTRWIKIKPFNVPHWRDDLATVMRGCPDGIIVPQAETPEQVRMLAAELYEMESRCGLTINTTQIVLEAGASATGAIRIGEFLHDPHPRLSGFIWNGRALAQSLGASTTQGKDATLTDTLRFTRIQVLLIARALGLMAIEAPFEDIADVRGGLTAAIAARRDGFTGMAAAHPRQINPILHAFSPDAFADNEQ